MPIFFIDTRDKPGLLIAAMRAFEGGQVSFEGEISQTNLGLLPGVSTAETPELRRSILECGGVSGFVVVPLTSENIVAIWKTVTDKEHLAYPSNIIHTQIAINGRLVFGAYDNFHRDCVFVSDRFPKEKLDQLVQSGVIRAYKLDATVSEVTVGECSIPV